MIGAPMPVKSGGTAFSANLIENVKGDTNNEESIDPICPRPKSHIADYPENNEDGDEKPHREGLRMR